MRAVYSGLLTLTIGACVACGPSAPAPRAPDAAPMSPHVTAFDLTSKTVALVRQGDEGLRAYCSGVWLDEDTIVTAAHCVDDEDEGAVLGYLSFEDVFGTGPEASPPLAPRGAYLTSVDEAHDIALLHAPKAPPHASAPLASENPAAGDHVAAMGHPLGLWWSFSEGVVAAVRKESLGLDILWVQATVQISPGNSGGGLFNERGELVGVCSRAMSSARAQGLNFWVHVAYVKQLRGPKA
jgi:S1-C subfamily serine protease